MPHDNFIAVGVDTQTHQDGIHVRLIFVDHEENTRPVILRRQDIPSVLASLQKEIASGSVVPIRPQDLQIGTDYKLTGWECHRKSDGGADLTLAVELLKESRTVTLALRMSEPERLALVQHLQKGP